MLEAANLNVSYGPIKAVNDVSLFVEKGEIVVIVGSNGAGKTTLLRTLAGILAQSSGRVVIDGEDISNSRSPLRVAKGIVLVPEGRRLFNDLTVEENLRLGAFHWRRSAQPGELAERLRSCYLLFPDLERRKTQSAGTLSGGQQQMVAVARGLMSRPAYLLLDEPSLGLAPLVIRQIFSTLLRLRSEMGLSILLVEQDANAALAIADRGYVMQRSRIVMSGTGEALRNDPMTQEIYFGASSDKV